MMDMPFNLNEEKALTLLEVMAALVILSLLSVTLLSLFTTSGLWLAGASRQTIAGEYATAIIEAVRAYANDVNPATLPLHWEDTNLTDENFVFQVGPDNPASPQVAVKAPADMKAVVEITLFDDSTFYGAGFERTIENNLLQVTVIITWNEGGHSRQQELATIVSMR
jgi:prepilin-type N-terminal cleavage/methylation domain-containing protein